jgi:hypothetical protein
MAAASLNRIRRSSWRVFGLMFLLPATGLTAQDGGKTSPPAAPTFSVPGGVFTNDVSLALSSQTPSATICYTLDGSEPGASSPSYSAPILLTNSTVVRARVFASRQPAGDLAIQSYVLLEPDVIDFNSNLPLVLINTFAQEIRKHEKLAASARIIDTRRGRASIIGAADFDGRALINLRGRASLRYPKRSYTLKTVDESEDVATFSILGLPKESDWVLYAPYPDKTLMRDVLAYELSNQIGRWAPRTRFVELFLNESGGKVGRRDYLGVYVFEEKVKRDKNRVNIANLGPDDNAETKLTGGYVFKKDHSNNDGGGGMWGPGPAFQDASTSRNGFPTGPGGFPGDPEGFQPAYRGTSRSTSGSSSSSRSSRSSNLIVTNYLGAPTRRPPSTTSRTIIRSDDGDEIEINEEEDLREYFRSGTRTNKFYYVDPEPDELTGVQRAWLQNYVNQCEAAVYSPDFKDPAKGYAAFLDPGSFIDYHLLVEVTKNVDGFRFSTFYHKDRGGKIKMGPIWDWNLSFGNCNGKQGYLPEWWLWPQLDDREYSWFRRLFEDPDFSQKYVDRWTELRATAFGASNLLGRVDALAALLQEAQARNFERWPILGSAINPNWFAGDTYAEEVNWMKEWIAKRLAWIDKQFVQAPSADAPADGKLSLSAPLGKIHYTLDGSDPRAPGGAVSSQALVYESPLALPPGKTVLARAQHNNRWSGPLRFSR